MFKEWRFRAQYEVVKGFFNIGIKSLMTASYTELVKALFVANQEAEKPLAFTHYCLFYVWIEPYC